MSSTATTRPTLVKIIVIVYGVCAIGLIYIAARIARVWWESPGLVFRQLGAVPAYVWACDIVVASLNIMGTIQLFRMRRSSFALFLAALVCATGQNVTLVVANGITRSMQHPYQWGGYIVGALVCWYTWKLRKGRMLR